LLLVVAYKLCIRISRFFYAIGLLIYAPIDEGAIILSF